MALQRGDVNATAGMSKAIYDQLDNLLSPALPNNMVAADLEKVRKGWKQLAFAIATGVIDHISGNLEIRGVVTTGSVNGTTVTCTQSNDGTGRVL